MRLASLRRPVITVGAGGCLVGISFLSLGLTASSAAAPKPKTGDPLLTLVKEVVNLAGGTAVASDFTLTATGPVTISGPGNSASVRNEPVPNGTYELGESGPPNYSGSGWDCFGTFVSSTTDSVTLGTGDNATCGIINTFVAPTTTTTTTLPPPSSTVPAETTSSTPGTTTTTAAPEATTTVPSPDAGGVPAAPSSPISPTGALHVTG